VELLRPLLGAGARAILLSPCHFGNRWPDWTPRQQDFGPLFEAGWNWGTGEQAMVNKTTDRKLPGSHRVLVSTLGDVVAVSQSLAGTGVTPAP